MGMSPHLARLRAVIGHDLLVLPCVSVLPADADGRILLGWQADHGDGWSTVGGAVEPGESSAEAAVREAREEIGVDIRLGRLLGVLGGPDYEVTYPNGDRVAYVPAVYEAAITAGAPAPADGELSEVGWFTPAQLRTIRLNRLTRALLAATGYLGSA